jgi:hypothetical protein
MLNEKHKIKNGTKIKKRIEMVGNFMNFTLNPE